MKKNGGTTEPPRPQLRLATPMKRSLMLAVVVVVFMSVIYVTLARSNTKPTNSLLHEETKDIVIDFIYDNYPDWASAQLPKSWTKKVIQELNVLVYRGPTVIFEGERWRIVIKSPFTFTPIHEVSVQYTDTDETCLTWNGTVNLEFGGVTEKSISGEPGIKTEEAKTP